MIAAARIKGQRDPAATRAAILAAANAEFGAQGFGGARIDQIAARANSNERSLYYHFGNKEALFVAVLERAYEDLVAAETALDLPPDDPELAMRRLIGFTLDYYASHPDMLSLLNSANLYQGRHVRGSARIAALSSPQLGIIGRILAAGIAAGRFRADVTAEQVMLTISALGYFPLANQWTLSVYLGRDLASPAAREAWRVHVTRVVMAFLAAPAII